MTSQQPFGVNIGRRDPYKSYAFLVYFGTSTTPVAGVTKVTALKRSTDVVEHKEGGNAIIIKGLGRTKYEPITLEQGVTHDETFAAWADAVQVLDKGAPQTSLKNAYQDLAIVLCNVSQWQDPADTDPNIAWAKETYEALHPHLAVRQYLNNLPADDGRIARGLWGANYERLVAIKRRYDPDNTFRLNHNIDPAWPGTTAVS